MEPVGLATLLAPHAAMDAQLARETAALLAVGGAPAGGSAGDLSLAETLWRHLHAEEAVLLPAVGRALGEEGERWADLVARDHGLIRGLLPRLGQAPDCARARALALRDARALARVLEHHDERERRWLEERLDHAFSAPERVELLRRFAEVEASLQMPAWTPAPDAEDPVLSAQVSLLVDGPGAAAARLAALAATVDGPLAARARALAAQAAAPETGLPAAFDATESLRRLLAAQSR